MLSTLPAPSRAPPPRPEAADAAPAPGARPARDVPPYGKRAGFVPRKLEDFGDGGAFPELRLAQFPLDMGRPDAIRSDQTLALAVASDGGVKYDAIVKQGKNKDKIVVSEHSALVPKVDKLGADALAKPGEDEVEATVAATRAALDALVAGKVAAVQPKTLPKQPGEATYIRYTPANQDPSHNSGAKERIIKMQDMPVDPLQPPKFRHTRVPRGPGSPPVPVMHSPPKPVSAKDAADWKIPPCISNWKNAKGYTIPLDKRLAADGRGLQEVAVNDGFAKFAEALYVAEQTARQSVELRSKVQRELAAKDKDRKERELRELAAKARLDRVGGGVGGGGPAYAAPSDLPPPPPLAARGGGDAGYGGEPAGAFGGDHLPPPPPRHGDGLPPPPPMHGDLPPPPSHRGGGDGETEQERAERARRDEIRADRRRERERDRRLEAAAAGGPPGKKSKLARDADRDVSEKVALGQARVGGGGEAMYDQRLFNQEGGMASGLAAEDAYNLYDKPLFADRGSSLYRPRAAAGGDDDDAGPSARSFKPDKGFAGADYGGGGRDGAAAGPVQFERGGDAEADPFGLDEFIGAVSARRDKPGPLDAVGGGGGMKAAGGGGSYDDYKGGSSRSRVDFQKGKE